MKSKGLKIGEIADGLKQGLSIEAIYKQSGFRDYKKRAAEWENALAQMQNNLKLNLPRLEKVMEKVKQKEGEVFQYIREKYFMDVEIDQFINMSVSEILNPVREYSHRQEAIAYLYKVDFEGVEKMSRKKQQSISKNFELAIDAVKKNKMKKMAEKDKDLEKAIELLKDFPIARAEAEKQLSLQKS